VRASDRRLVGAEALLRWSHPEKGMISPAFFIPVAEETRLIVPLGEWVLRESCRQAMQWSAASDGEQPYLSVNVSSRQFHGGFGREVVTQILRDTGFPAQRLVFEITESLLMEEDERVSKALLEFRQMGIGLAVDDFGTGFSSLSYLRRFPLTSLKIDYSFVRDMEVDPADAQLVESIVVMAQRLKLKVIAEGVETQGQADMLQALSCDLLQGFLFSRPVPLVELNQLLEKDAL
jgi:EAL domain-containing protein (putative c-di-GMP-specific phosphodiesterase class I)